MPTALRHLGSGVRVVVADDHPYTTSSEWVLATVTAPEVVEAVEGVDVTETPATETPLPVARSRARKK